MLFRSYTFTRNQFGSDIVNGREIPVRAFTNAMRVVRFERWIGLFHEESVQEVFLPYHWLLQVLNTYYGTAHFIVTIGVFIVLYRKRPDVFPQYRNALAITTGLAIAGFSLWFSDASVMVSLHRSVIGAGLHCPLRIHRSAGA